MTGVVLEDIAKTYTVDGREVRALDGIDTAIERGSFVSVVGYSGSGKSTLLRVLGGLEPPSRGSVRKTGMDGRTGMVFQEPRLVRSLTVEQNMALALKHTRDPRKRRKTVDSSLELVGLAEFRRAYPGQLSGGMAQRAALGRALCREPDLLLMDEPFGALDALTRKRLQSELVRIYRLTGMTVVFVTHDVTEAVSLGRRVFVMERGRIRDEVPVPFPYPRNQSSADFIALRDRVLTQILSRDEGVSVAI
jgi:sulfonate transport system ATP-binding protein